ncbi:hypothetical protein X801_00410 [Opisthorchis viverrini]|uniref:Uncharacterized protein n=1 Tax=Opisthorchis viverrini TaxID=6198 RepID=A0A1S8XAB6_OPIVI|nr:hypothetical protein X801_00410 [Opisthorchis viverrini]
MLKDPFEADSEAESILFMGIVHKNGRLSSGNRVESSKLFNQRATALVGPPLVSMTASLKVVSTDLFDSGLETNSHRAKWQQLQSLVISDCPTCLLRPALVNELQIGVVAASASLEYPIERTSTESMATSMCLDSRRMAQAGKKNI